MKVKVSLDPVPYKRKPPKKVISEISIRVAQNEVEMNIEELADQVGNQGHTFSPSIFKYNIRNENNFDEMQLFALDFDAGITVEEVRARAERYHLPIAFMYDTFSSSSKCRKFRTVFINDIPVMDKRAAKIIIGMLLRIFPEADRNCSDVSRMFFGGKCLIGKVKEETINIADLTYRFQQYLMENDPKKYARNLERFAKKYNILLVDHCLRIGRVHSDGSCDEMGGKTAGDEYLYMSNAEKSPQYIIIIPYQDCVRNTDRALKVIRTDLSDIDKRCQLYCDFVRNDHVPHEDRFLLMTNLIHLEGGIKRFKKHLEKHGYDMKAWSYYIKYAKDAKYLPMTCNGNCGYADVCHHKTNMVLTIKESPRIKKLGDDDVYYYLNEVNEHVSDCFAKAVNEKIYGLQLIHAQTAVGKTEVYCSYVRQHEEYKFLIAVPTNKLKNEVWLRLKKMGVSAMETSSLDELELPAELRRRILYYYQLGLGRNISIVLREFIKLHSKEQENEMVKAIGQCKDYLQTCEDILNHRVIVTTHAKLITLSEDILKDYVIIIDEDILPTLFKNIQTVPLADIKKTVVSGACPEALRTRLQQILNTDPGMYSKFITKTTYEYLPEGELEKLEIRSDINDIAFASTFVLNGDCVNYYYPVMIPRAHYIVFSATMDTELYRNYFRGWAIVEYPYKKARYLGKLKQLTAYTMSRQSILTHKEKLIQYLNSFKDSHKLITFLKYEEELHGSGLHFGNAEGIDEFKGKNIIIVGTPHLSEFIYKLIGCHLDINVNSDVLAERTVQYHDYEFRFMTYSDEDDLQNLQLYFISKELEQCIGRARLLRNDCEVIVLSNFPCEQAEIDQSDYLEGLSEDEK